MNNNLSDKILDVIINYNVVRETVVNDPNCEQFINKFVKKIYVINLDKDKVRRNYMLCLLKKYNINFEFIIVSPLNDGQYDAIKKQNRNINKGQSGCYFSHMYCLNDAVQNNYTNIIILEDDIIFHKKFHSLFEHTMLQDSYDILMLGASDFDFYKSNYILNAQHNIYQSNTNNKYLYGTFSIYYSLKGYTDFFKTKLVATSLIDYNLANIHKNISNNIGVCMPNLIIADNSTTNINNTYGINNRFYNGVYLKKCYNNKLNYHDYNTFTICLLNNPIFNDADNFRKKFANIIDECLNKTKINYNPIDDFFTEDDVFFILYNGIFT